MTNAGSLRALVLWPALLLLAVLPLLSLSGARAQQAPPQLAFSSPAPGDVLEEPPFVIQFCFAEPIDIRDLQNGGQWEFRVHEPDGRRLGTRTAFQGDGLGATVYPGEPPGPAEGEWTIAWLASTPDNSQSAQGEIKFTVDPANGDPISREVPPFCIGPAGTASPRPATPVRSPSPTMTAQAEDGPSPSPRPAGNDEDGDEPDVLLLALLTIGAAGAAALIALIGYFVRRAVGYEPHKPTGDGSAPGDHH